jgi:hypothetical protein
LGSSRRASPLLLLQLLPAVLRRLVLLVLLVLTAVS